MYKKTIKVIQNERLGKITVNILDKNGRMGIWYNASTGKRLKNKNNIILTEKQQ